MKNRIVSILLTLLLGPGVGHLYLKKYRRGLIFILASLFFAGLFALRVVKAFAGADLSSQNPSELLKDFYSGHPKLTFFYDAVFAAVWAYAVLDCYLLSKSDDKTFKTSQESDEKK